MSPSTVRLPFYGSANKMTIRDRVTSYLLLRLFISLLEKQNILELKGTWGLRRRGRRERVGLLWWDGMMGREMSLHNGTHCETAVVEAELSL